MSEWISTKEAAARLDRSEDYIRRLASQGRLTVERLGPPGRGGRWLISAAAVERLRAAWAVTPPSPGRPPDPTPTPTALAKRKSRARRAQEGG